MLNTEGRGAGLIKEAGGFYQVGASKKVNNDPLKENE
jgi:hypothetical protein